MMNETEFYSAIKSKSLQGGYLLHGPEELTKAFALEQAKAMLEPSLADMNYLPLHAPEPEAFLAAVDQLPFFDERRVVVVTGFDEGFLSALEEKGRLTRFPPETIVLFVQRGSIKKTSRLYKALQPMNRVVEYGALNEDRALQKVQREAALRNVQIDRATALYLIHRVGLDGYRLVNEFSKAAGFVGRGGTVTKAVVEQVTTASEEFTSFSIIDDLLDGNKKQGYRKLSQALMRGDSAMGLAGLMVWRLKQLLIARECLDLGMNEAAIKTKLGGNPNAAYYTIKNARRRSANSLRRGIAAFTEVSANVRQGIYKDREALLLAVFDTFESREEKQA